MRHSLSITTWNVHYDDMGAKPQYGAFSWATRMPLIIDELLRVDSDIILLQEVPQFDVQSIKRALPAYRWEFIAEKSRGGKWNIGIGVKPDVGDPKFSEFDFRKIGRHCEKVLFALIKDTLVCNVHFPKGKLGRQTMVENFGKVLSNFKYKRLIIGGDFNALPYDGGYEQIALMNALSGTYSATEYAKNESDDKLALKSYMPYPYNVISPKFLKVKGKLDHILARNLIAVDPIVHNATLIPRSNVHLSEHFAITVTLKP